MNAKIFKVDPYMAGPFLREGKSHAMSSKTEGFTVCGVSTIEVKGREDVGRVTCLRCIRSAEAAMRDEERAKRETAAEMETARREFASSRSSHHDSPRRLAVARAFLRSWPSANLEFCDSDCGRFLIVSIKWLKVHIYDHGDVEIVCGHRCTVNDGSHEGVFDCGCNSEACLRPFQCAMSAMFRFQSTIKSHFACFGYPEYLRSEPWFKRTQAVKRRDGFKCMYPGCGSPRDLQVHHLTYANIGNEPLEDLVTLCRFHHESVEGFR